MSWSQLRRAASDADVVACQAPQRQIASSAASHRNSGRQAARSRSNAVRVAQQQVQPRRNVLDAMDEDGEVHARRPPHTVPRRPRARQDTREHVDECRTVDRRPPVEGDGAPALQQERTRVDLTIAPGLLIVSGQPARRHTRSPWIFGGPSDLVDERPLDVILAQLTRAARPLAARDGVDELSHGLLRAIERLSGGHRHDAAGLFAFGFDEVLLAIDAGHRRDRAVRPRRQQRGTPPDEPGGDRHAPRLA